MLGRHRRWRNSALSMNAFIQSENMVRRKPTIANAQPAQGRYADV